MEKLLTKQNDRRFHLRAPATSKADRDCMTSQRIRRMRSKLRSSRAHDKNHHYHAKIKNIPKTIQ